MVTLASAVGGVTHIRGENVDATVSIVTRFTHAGGKVASDGSGAIWKKCKFI